MKKNMGVADRIIRFLTGGVLGWLYYAGILKGVPGIVLLVLGIIFVLTSLVGLCPLYALFGINSCQVTRQRR